MSFFVEFMQKRDLLLLMCWSGVSFTRSHYFVLVKQSLNVSAMLCLALVYGLFPVLTHRGQETLICVTKGGHQWFGYWLGAKQAPSHYLNQCWITVNWTLANISQWNFDNFNNFHWIKCIWKWHMRNGSHLASASSLNVLTHWGQVLHIQSSATITRATIMRMPV